MLGTAISNHTTKIVFTGGLIVALFAFMVGLLGFAIGRNSAAPTPSEIEFDSGGGTIDPDTWQIGDCNINNTQDRCASYVNPDDKIRLMLARQAGRAVFVLPKIKTKDGNPVAVSFAHAQPGVWFDDEVGQAIPPDRVAFSKDGQALLLLDYNHFVRRASVSKSVSIGFRLLVEGKQVEGLTRSDFRLPPIPQEYVPGKDEGGWGWGTGIKATADATRPLS